MQESVNYQYFTKYSEMKGHRPNLDSPSRLTFQYEGVVRMAIQDHPCIWLRPGKHRMGGCRNSCMECAVGEGG